MWGEEQALDFFEPILAMLSKDDQDSFVKCKYYGSAMEILTYGDLADGGLPVGLSRHVFRVLNSIKSGDSNSKRKPVSCELDAGNTDRIQAKGRKPQRKRTCRRRSDTRGRMR